MLRVVPATRRCIYCLAADVRLSKEHVVPKGLGGELILLKASCDRCAIEIRGFEEWCIRHMFEVPRTLFQVKSSKKHIKRERRLLVGFGHGAETRWEQSDFDRFPFSMHVPMMAPPPLLSGIMNAEGKWEVKKVWSWISPEFQQRADALGGEVSVAVVLEFERLCRFISKIAHGFAVAELGLEGFIPMGCNCIRGISDPVSMSLVGMAVEQLKLESPELHEMRLLPTDEFITVLVQLFAPLNSPTFQAVVGRPMPAKP